MDMQLTFLGTGTSTGVPQLRCGCEVCRSADPRDHRLRASALLEADGKRILIDCGPDFRQQLLVNGSRSEEDRLDALLLTHQHYDHVGGIDDLRPYCYGFEDGFPVYCQKDVASDLRARLPYSFAENPYPGVPRFDLREIRPYEPFEAAGIEFLPLQVNHYKLEIVGFRTGGLGYITDAKKICRRTIEALQGIDTLVINALRITEHISHLSLSESLEVIELIKPRRAFLTHCSHQLGLHAKVERILPAGVSLAYDNLKLNIKSLRKNVDRTC